MNKINLVDTGEKSKVVTFRLGETLYQALEKLAEQGGGTVSSTARQLLVESLRSEPLEFGAGNMFKDMSSSSAVFIVTESTTDEQLDRAKKLAKEVIGSMSRSKK